MAKVSLPAAASTTHLHTHWHRSAESRKPVERNREPGPDRLESPRAEMLHLLTNGWMDRGPVPCMMRVTDSTSHVVSKEEASNAKDILGDSDSIHGRPKGDTCSNHLTRKLTLDIPFLDTCARVPCQRFQKPVIRAWTDMPWLLMPLSLFPTLTASARRTNHH